MSIAWEITDEPEVMLAEFQSLSERNKADTPLDRSSRDPSPPWLVALASILSGGGTFNAVPTSRWVLPVYDGDPPEQTNTFDSVEQLIAAEAGKDPLQRHVFRAADSRALVHREFARLFKGWDGWVVDVRGSHQRVHEALSSERYEERMERIKREGGVLREVDPDERTAGPMIAGCQWCRKDDAR